MWEQTAHSAHDFTKLIEMNQYLSTVNNQTASYLLVAKRIQRYQQMLSSPYFGRFDFQEEGEAREQIYLGKANVLNPATQKIQVYDWRAPIASIFYRYELGPASYKAPVGEIPGQVLLKRQYKITNSQLEYFFDSGIRITDDVLQEILSKNSSPQMRTIVETIQKEQDLIIRDQESDLLIVQGVAGSGKTSIALHRIAFLLYEGLNSKLKVDNFLIISPSDLFSVYISQVLPELGEENVAQTTFKAIAEKFFQKRFMLESRAEQLECLVRDQNSLKTASCAFKSSKEFFQILQRLIPYYLKRLPFSDISYAGELIATKQELKNRFFNSKLELPPARQLKRIEQLLKERAQPLQKKSLKRLEKIVASHEEHAFEEERVSRLLTMKKNQAFQKEMHKFTAIDFFEPYLLLFSHRKLFFSLAKGLELPPEIEEILAATEANLARGFLSYEEIAPLLFLKLKLEGSAAFSQVLHVLIDEAQDYNLFHYEIFKLLFPDAKFTILGDVNQTLEKELASDFYHEVSQILARANARTHSLNRSYRASLELSLFSQKLLPGKVKLEPFLRPGEKPQFFQRANENQLIEAMAEELNKHLGSKGTRAVICKTMTQAKMVAAKLENFVGVNLLTESDAALEGEVVVLPSYLAKGLEFDLVMIYNVNHDNYHTSYCDILK